MSPGGGWRSNANHSHSQYGAGRPVKVTPSAPPRSRFGRMSDVAPREE